MAEKKKWDLTFDENSRLHRAIENNDLDTIKTVTQLIDVNALLYDLSIMHRMMRMAAMVHMGDRRAMEMGDRRRRDDECYTGLHYSVKQNKINCVRLYLQLGADITIKDEILGKGGWTKKTPLERAVDDNKVDIIYCMIKEFNKDVSSVDQAYQKKVREVISQVDRDVTKSSKWPVVEKVAKALFTSPLPSHLECEICLDVLDDPVMTTCCGQSYCKECIGKVHNKVCPHCRGKIETFPDKKSVRFINELKICCPYHIDDKCQWKGAPSELLNHLKVCKIKPIMCQHGCGKQLEKNNMIIHVGCLCSLRVVFCSYCYKKFKDKDLVKHTGGCPKMPLPCPNKCPVTKVITREEMKQHLEVCPDQVVACKYSELGCHQNMKRKELDQHMSSVMQDHLDLVAKKAISEENARKQLEREVASLKAIVMKLTNK